MDTRQARILEHVRALSLRDNVGPDSFPIAATGAAQEPEDSSPDEEPLFAEDSFDEGTGESAIIDGPSSSDEGSSRTRRTRSTRESRPVTSRKRRVRPPQAVRPTLTPEAAKSYARALSGKQLSAQDIIHLEAIVLPTLRPAFDIVNESYDLLPANWNIWNQKRPAVDPLLHGVGRLQLTGHPSYTLVGTGFVCGPNAVLTNRHVAQIFVEGIGSGAALTYTPGVTCAMDMLAEVGSSASLLLDVDQPLTFSDLWDVAILHCQNLPAAVTPLPLASAAPATLNGGDVTIVGYPSYDPYESLADQANIFRTVFDRKRFQPGKMNGRADVLSFGKTVSAITHDCSTLGGNSGSALLCADTMQIIGIHFSGVTHVSNYAVPVWELMADPAFAGHALNFH
jgi:endonuclease G